MNPFRRFFEIVANPSNSRTVGVLVILIIALAIPLTVNIAQKQQELRQRANFEESRSCDPNASCSGSEWSYPPCPEQGSDYHHAVCGGTDYGCYNTPIVRCSTNPAPASNSKPVCPGTCTGVQTCQNADANGFGVAGRVDTQYACSTGACCIIDPIPGACIKTCQNGQVVADGPAAACAQVTNPDCSTPAGGGGGTCTLNGGHCLANIDAISCPTGETPQDNLTCPNGRLCCKAGDGTSGTGGACPQITAGGSQGAGGNCDTGSPNVNIGSCTTTVHTCPSGPGPGHTISVCQYNAQAGRLCYANNPAECWPDSACPVSGTPITPGLGAPTPSSPSSSTCPSSCQFGCGNSGPSICNLRPAAAPAAPAPAAPSAATCKTDPASASTCAFACNIVNGVNMKCNIQNQNTSGVCSGVCTGQWNCAVDSACQNPNGAILSFGLGLDGIGTTGDVKNPNLSNAKSPNHSIRNLTLKLINSSGVEVSTFNGNISYSSGKFTANVNLGSVALGTYTIKIKSDGYLWRLINTPLTITTGTVTYTLTGSPVSLVAGDIVVNNAVDIQDYSQLNSCIFKTVSAVPGCQTSDLDDNGIVDLSDFNLLLREFGITGQ